MDGLAEELGRLSTSAPEWTPSGSAASASSGGSGSGMVNVSAAPQAAAAGVGEGGGGGGGMDNSSSNILKHAEKLEAGGMGVGMGGALGGGGAGAVAAAVVREFVPGVGLTTTATASPPAAPPPPQSQEPPPAAAAGGVGAAAGGVRSDALPWHDPHSPHHADSHHHPHHADDSHLGQHPHHSQHHHPHGPSHLPAPPPPATPYTSRRTLASLGLPEDLHAHYRALDAECARELPPDDPRLRAIPPSFINAWPLDGDHDGGDASGGGGSGKRSSFGYPGLTFRVTSREDGRLYCLRRYDSCGRAVSHKIAGAVRDAWVHAVDPSSAPPPPPHHGHGHGHAHGEDQAAAGVHAGSRARRLVDHPGLVRLYRAFVSHRAAFFVHRYHPGARTLRERFFDSHRLAAAGGGGGAAGLLEPPLPEALLWNIAVQLVGAMRAVHGANLACRTVQLNHVLAVPEEGVGCGAPPSHDEYGDAATGSAYPDAIRVRINCVGVVDSLEYESRKSVRDLQRDDVRSLGRLILSLAAGAELTAAGGAPGAVAVDWADDSALGRLDSLLGRRRYTSRLRRFGLTLAASPDPPGINAVSESVAHRSLDCLDRAHASLDRTSSALGREYDASRLLRLLLKLGHVNDRPEFGHDPRWSETGDRYVLQLFRDYLFHQCDGAGRPAMDLGHVLGTLARLEAAREDERLVLASRDGRSLFVVTYADVARCLEGAFGELVEGMAPLPHGHRGGGGGVDHHGGTGLGGEHIGGGLEHMGGGGAMMGGHHHSHNGGY